MLSPSPRKKARRNVLTSLGVLAFITFLFFRGEPLAPWQSALTCLTSFFLVFFLWVIVISFQALLPVTNFLDDPLQCILEVYRTSFYLLLHMVGLHGPAVFVKDGKDNRTNEDAGRESWPGVVVIDSNSAAVFVERNPPPGLAGAFINILTMIGQILMLIDPPQRQANTGLTLPRMRGAGIVFTRPRERIHGTVDLRKQFRGRGGVSAYTRDGIEVTSRILSLFTIGENPTEEGAVLYVTYVGERLPQNLRVITLRRDPDNPGAVFVDTISEQQEDLDEPDRAEIHSNFLRRLDPPFRNQKGLRVDARLMPFRWAPPQMPQPVFNERRVFEAVFAQASQKIVNPSSEMKNGDGWKYEPKNDDVKIMNWTELPTHVASGFFREILSRLNYDELYDARGEGQFPLPGFRRLLALTMRNNGILAYKLVINQSGTDLIAGRRYVGTGLLATTEIELSNPKVLRDRGIRVTFASFGDPLPVNKAIYQQRLDSWRAQWEREWDLEMADQDLSAMRARINAYAQTQEDLFGSLNQLFADYENADEALTLRLMQALETYAADPRTRELLPEYTLGLLRQTSNLLLPPTENVLPPR